MLKLAWRIVNMMLTAIVLIALTRRVGWVDWQLQFAQIADYYSMLRDDVLAVLSVPFPFDFPAWAGDVFLLWWTVGQADYLRVLSGNTWRPEDPTGLGRHFRGKESQHIDTPNLKSIVFAGTLGVPLLMVNLFSATFRMSFIGNTVAYLNVEDVPANTPYVEARRQEDGRTVYVYDSTRYPLRRARQFFWHVIMLGVIPFALLITALFWVALAANYYTALFPLG